MTQLYCEVSDGNAGLLVLLHGLGATADVWSPFIDARPESIAGRIAVLDLPGHGESGGLDDYAMPAVAARIADTLRARLRPVQDCVLLGHSYGGVAAIELAGADWGLHPQHVLGLGIKTCWSDDELAHMRRLAAKPAKSFQSAAEANEWYRKTTGLAGLADHPERYTRRGVRQTKDGQWRLALDPAVYAVGDPGMDRLMGKACCPVSLGYGAADRMIDADDMRRHDRDADAIRDGGHNVMVTHPDAVWEWLQRRLRG